MDITNIYIGFARTMKYIATEAIETCKSISGNHTLKYSMNER
jgi:hypothetical protein